MNDLLNARRLLDEGGYTCVICRGDEVHTATARGVKPLVNWLDNGLDVADGCAADKVVGKATAFLYCLLGVRAVYAHIMSKGAAEVLRNAGITAEYGRLVPGIINRTGTGPCPFEAAVTEISAPELAMAAIRRKMKEMNIV
ncbi:MAG: DUF1893 domain-containing protein [Oscillospiraceae bacterium]|nr:DUF1893 domain-containing protein [Oscillospiraceae bacterium]